MNYELHDTDLHQEENTSKSALVTAVDSFGSVTSPKASMMSPI